MQVLPYLQAVRVGVKYRPMKRTSTPEILPATDPSKNSVTKRGKVGAYRQALDMQRIMFEMAMGAGTKQDKALGAKAWVMLEEQKRILKGRPLPGSLKPVTPKSKSNSVPDMEPIDQ